MEELNYPHSPPAKTLLPDTTEVQAEYLPAKFEELKRRALQLIEKLERCKKELADTKELTDDTKRKIRDFAQMDEEFLNLFAELKSIDSDGDIFIAQPCQSQESLLDFQEKMFKMHDEMQVLKLRIANLEFVKSEAAEVERRALIAELRQKKDEFEHELHLLLKPGIANKYELERMIANIDGELKLRPIFKELKISHEDEMEALSDPQNQLLSPAVMLGLTRSFKNIRNIVRKLILEKYHFSDKPHLTRDELFSILERKKQREKMQVSYFATPEGAISIFMDKEIKNMWELDRSNPGIGKMVSRPEKEREEAEKTLGWDKGQIIHAVVSTSDNPKTFGFGYGNVEFILDLDDLKTKSTFTIGDSMMMRGITGAELSSAHIDNRHLQIAMGLLEARGLPNAKFIEIQIGKKIKLDDIRKVRIHVALGRLNAPAAYELAEVYESKGIPVEVIGAPFYYSKR
ncbi:MAG: hypothetical protein UT33_C0013G0031 [Candidatus Peregrinibacteria bacterium GW2011_GWC2_39_14]|nr:MAG: hypothetical protein US92_C0007G0082 [Candidatus Peregrinibacteria bacterium GW2011_GWA2_38_36]KKR05179.1 MAG: hypothetical protein UT33_C0013G0031 [Candidatus Peregrinibacteria bacterium GW2011_GWC2_39_14]